jgi:hypothetical protein
MPRPHVPQNVPSKGLLFTCVYERDRSRSMDMDVYLVCQHRGNPMPVQLRIQAPKAGTQRFDDIPTAIDFDGEALRQTTLRHAGHFPGTDDDY